MRLTPAVGGLLPRTVLEGGATIDGHTFPPGTRVGVPGYSVHHNPKYFPSPFTYKPDRWLVDDKVGVSAEDVKRAQNAFFQFSIGPRGCVGKTLAYAEMTVAVARIIWLFDVQPVGSETSADKAGFLDVMRTRGEIPTQDKFVSHPENLFLKFKSRQS
jgi:cytochrome P450